jgi:hypothetical protein
MNVDRRMLSPVPSMDSGSEGEENLRISRNLSTHTQYLEVELGRRFISVMWNSDQIEKLNIFRIIEHKSLKK